LDCYNCNSEKYNQAKKTNRQINGKNTERSKAAVYKQKQRSDLKLKREGQRQYKQLYRNRKRQEVDGACNIDGQHNAVNMNRISPTSVFSDAVSFALYNILLFLLRTSLYTHFPSLKRQM
jgi:hypothetical protein